MMFDAVFVSECLTKLRKEIDILDKDVYRNGDTAPRILTVKMVSGEGIIY